MPWDSSGNFVRPAITHAMGTNALTGMPIANSGQPFTDTEIANGAGRFPAMNGGFNQPLIPSGWSRSNHYNGGGGGGGMSWGGFGGGMGGGNDWTGNRRPGGAPVIDAMPGDAPSPMAPRGKSFGAFNPQARGIGDIQDIGGFQPVQGFADGGYPPDGISVVGERGPELINKQGSNLSVIPLLPDLHRVPQPDGSAVVELNRNPYGTGWSTLNPDALPQPTSQAAPVMRPQPAAPAVYDNFAKNAAAIAAAGSNASSPADLISAPSSAPTPTSAPDTMAAIAPSTVPAAALPSPSSVPTPHMFAPGAMSIGNISLPSAPQGIPQPQPAGLPGMPAPAPQMQPIQPVNLPRVGGVNAPPDPLEKFQSAINPQREQLQIQRLMRTPQGMMWLNEQNMARAAHAQTINAAAGRFNAAQGNREAQMQQQAQHWQQQEAGKFQRQQTSLTAKDAQKQQEAQRKAQLETAAFAGEQARMNALVQQGVISPEIAAAYSGINDAKVLKNVLDHHQKQHLEEPRITEGPHGETIIQGMHTQVRGGDKPEKMPQVHTVDVEQMAANGKPTGVSKKIPHYMQVGADGTPYMIPVPIGAPTTTPGTTKSALGDVEKLLQRK